jgi:hypothetical protein
MIIRPSLSGSLGKNVIPPLDIEGMPTARLAYGLRKLRSAYTGPALRVRNGTTNVEADVYFYNNKEVTNNSMTSAGVTLQHFLGDGVAGYVPKWYNQSGNTSTQAGGGSWTGYDTDPDAVMTTGSRQPVLVVDGVNIRARKQAPGLKFETSGGWSAAGDYMQVNQYRLPNGNNDAHTLIWVGQLMSLANHCGIIGNLDNFNDGVELIFLSPSGFRYSVDAHDEDTGNGFVRDDRNTIVIGSYDYSRATGAGGDGTSHVVRVNGNQTTRDTYEDKHIGRSDRFRLGARRISNSPLDGTMAEIFVFESFVSLELQALLETNIAIYNNIDLTNFLPAY